IGFIAVLGERALDPALPAEDVLRLCAARAEAELQRQGAVAVLEAREEQLRQITESAHEVFWLISWPRRELLYISRAYEDLTGLPIGGLYAQRDTWLAVVHPDD